MYTQHGSFKSKSSEMNYRYILVIEIMHIFMIIRIYITLDIIIL